MILPTNTFKRNTAHTKPDTGEDVTPADATCWTLIHAAAGGDRAARNDFARLYEPVARAYFDTRWQLSSRPGATDDAVQEVFVECFKGGGVLDRVVAAHPDGFRPFFHGVLRNIARRFESARGADPLPDNHPADDTSPSRAFDRAWAQVLLQEAARVQAETARAAGERAVKRVELLRLRFQEGLPIREIAARWNEDATALHHEYATARDEFRAALRRVVGFQMPTVPAAQLDAACRALLDALK